MKDLKRSLDKAKVGIMSAHNTAFIASVLFSLKHQWVEGEHEIKTAATDGINLVIHKDFWNGLNQDQQIGLLLHEAWHVALEHMIRIESKDMNKWNVAADHCINLMLVKDGFKIPEGGCCDKQYTGMSTEEIYNLLPDQDSSDGDIIPSPDDGEGNGDDENDSEGSGGNSAPSAAMVQAAVKEAIVRAANEAQANSEWGSLPNNIKRRIDEINNPKLDWKTVLQNHMSSYAKDDYSMKRPNRRFFPTHYLPSMYSEGMGEISIIIDTSGSIRQREFNEMIAEAISIKETLNPECMNFYCFDTALYEIGSFNREEDVCNLEMKGGGGTNITPALEMLTEQEPEVAIIFTDGYFRPSNIQPDTDLFWIIFNNPKWTTDYGEIIEYTFDKNTH